MLVMFGRMQRMPMGDLGMMCGFLVITGHMVFCRLTMMLGRVLMMFRGFLMVLMNIVTAHCALPDIYFTGVEDYRDR
jgi:hypothetical protein